MRSLNRVAVATQAGVAVWGGQCFVFGLAAGLALLSPADGAGQERSPSPKGPILNAAKGSSAPPGIEQLKAAPDDGELLKRFVNERSRAAIGLLPQDPNGAERLLSELRGLVKSLQPRTAAGKRQIAESLAAIDAYGKRVEIARVDIAHLRDQLAANPNQPEVIHRFFDKLAMEVYSLARTDPMAARKLLDDSVAFARAFREKLTDKESQRQYEQSTRRLDRLEATVGSSQRLAKLLGEPAAPLSVESWAHGEPLSAESLMGKVVLLDFWAVWCSPCVASLPKLDEWHQRWSAKGLVIIGLTQYYNFSWDERAERPARGEGK
ncbi:MAG: TlpA family protein disulfide reductase, partial [Planctomycetota bacterium]